MSKPRLKQSAQDGATNGQVVTFNTGTGRWEPQTPAAGALAPTDSVSDEVDDFIDDVDGTVLVDNMTRTPGAGNYLVWFDTSIDLSANNSNVQFSIFVNNIEVTRTRRRFGRGGNQTVNTIIQLSLHAKLIGVLAVQAIEVRADVSAGTVTIFERTLTWERVA